MRYGYILFIVLFLGGLLYAVAGQNVHVSMLLLSIYAIQTMLYLDNNNNIFELINGFKKTYKYSVTVRWIVYILEVLPFLIVACLLLLTLQPSVDIISSYYKLLSGEAYIVKDYSIIIALMGVLALEVLLFDSWKPYYLSNGKLYMSDSEIHVEVYVVGFTMILISLIMLAFINTTLLLLGLSSFFFKETVFFIPLNYILATVMWLMVIIKIVQVMPRVIIEWKQLFEVIKTKTKAKKRAEEVVFHV